MVDQCERDHTPPPALVLLIGLGREQWQQGGSCGSVCKCYKVVINTRALRRLGLQIQALFLTPYGSWPGSHLFSEVEGSCLGTEDESFQKDWLFSLVKSWLIG